MHTREEKLNRLIILETKSRRLERFSDGPDFIEYMELREEIIEEVLPLLDKLALSGLLSVHVESTRYLKKKYSSVTFDVNDTFIDGNIVLTLTDEPVTYSHRIRDDGHPNVGRDAAYGTYTKELYIMSNGKKGKYVDWLKNHEIALKVSYAQYLKT